MMPSSKSLATSQPRTEVLVVDDDAHVRRVIASELEKIGVRVTTCHSGGEALELASLRDFAVALLDVTLDGPSGLEIARLIRADPRNDHLPILFVSGRATDERTIARAYRLGAVDYLFKPIRPEVLLAKVKVFAALHERTMEVARQAERLRDAERLRAEVQRERALNEQLHRIDRKKDEIIAFVSHELRNPLVPLALGIELLERRAAVDEAMQQTFVRMKHQVAHIVRLADDLMDSARIGTGGLELRLEAIELGQVIERVQEQCTPSLDTRLQSLVASGPTTPVYLEADAVRLTQVVVNLVTNASKYSERGATISIRWGLEDSRGYVTVEDSGRGITRDVITRVFETFVHDGPGHGLGLGLALVKGIVELHGGSVHAHSEGPGTGATFTVRLPARRAPRHPEPEAPTDAPGHGGRLLQVVLVEDNDDVRTVVGCLIEAWGHRIVASVRTGAEGIAAVHDLEPDVALVDLGLPDMSGHDVARTLRRDCAKGKCPRLIAMSGYSPGAGSSEDRHFERYLVKPPQADVLRRALESPDSRPVTT